MIPSFGPVKMSTTIWPEQAERLAFDIVGNVSYGVLKFPSTSLRHFSDRSKVSQRAGWQLTHTNCHLQHVCNHMKSLLLLYDHHLPRFQTAPSVADAATYDVRIVLGGGTSLVANATGSTLSSDAWQVLPVLCEVYGLKRRPTHLLLLRSLVTQGKGAKSPKCGSSVPASTRTCFLACDAPSMASGD